MKYHLDTIPIWDAYNEHCECPLCIIKNKLESDFIKSFSGGAVMEPDIRIMVNEKGFCTRHFEMFYAKKMRLGLALMTHTNLRETTRKTIVEWEKMKKPIENAKKLNAVSDIAGKVVNKASGKTNIKSNKIYEVMQNVENFLDAKLNSCALCEKLVTNLERYSYTIHHLYNNDEEFLELYKESKGFCLEHFKLMMSIARETQSPKKCALWLEDTLQIMESNLNRLDEELKLFTIKFDYKNKDIPWGDSKDSLPRVLQKLTGNVYDE